MLEKEQQFVETKRTDLARGYNPAVAVELANAEKRVRELQQKYNQMATRLGLPASVDTQALVSRHFSLILFLILKYQQKVVDWTRCIDVCVRPWSIFFGPFFIVVFWFGLLLSVTFVSACRFDAIDAALILLSIDDSSFKIFLKFLCKLGESLT